MPATARVLSCYEAGRDGFWLHRHLVSVGIENEVIDAASIEVSRRLRHVKTDRLDGERLLAKRTNSSAGAPIATAENSAPSPDGSARPAAAARLSASRASSQSR